MTPGPAESDSVHASELTRMRNRLRLIAIPFGMMYWLGTAAAQEAGPPVDTNPFQGKVLAIYKKSDPEFIVTLEKARMVTLVGDVPFLVGTGTDNGTESWQTGLTIWVALSDVSEIDVFDSIEQLQDAMFDLGGLKVATPPTRPDATRRRLDSSRNRPRVLDAGSARARD